MRKLMMVALMMVTGWMAQAQPKVTSAYNANKEGKYEDAKQYIDEAMTDPKATEKEKYWRYRGDIYANLGMNSSENDKILSMFQESLNSYEKCIEKKTDYSEDICEMLFKMFGFCEKKYIELYESKDFCKAIPFTSSCLEIVEINEKLGLKSDISQTITGGKKSVDDNLNSFENMCISQRISSLIDEKKSEDALKLIEQEKLKNPNNVELLSYESDIFLSLGQFENASKSLEALVKTSPENAIYHYFLGNLYQKIDEGPNDALNLKRSLTKGDSERKIDSLATKYEVKLTKTESGLVYQYGDKSLTLLIQNGKLTDFKSQNLDIPIFSTRALDEYITCIRLDSLHYDSNYNLGAQYYNRAQEQSLNCNAIPPRETAKFDLCKSEMKALYLESAKHFKVCFEKDKNDLSLKKILKETYLKGGDREKSSLYN